MIAAPPWRTSRAGSSELERALLDGRIDIAVHSAKDVPDRARRRPGADRRARARADARDALCGASSLEALAPGARVGTSSLRRAAQLRALRPDLEIVALRGNVDTRLRKLAAGEADALVLAYAGLQRLGRGAEAGGVLDALVPAAGQGDARPGGAHRRPSRRPWWPRESIAVATACLRRRAHARARAGGLLSHPGRRSRASRRRRRDGAERLGGAARRIRMAARPRIRGRPRRPGCAALSGCSPRARASCWPRPSGWCRHDRLPGRRRPGRSRADDGARAGADRARRRDRPRSAHPRHRAGRCPARTRS